MDWLRRLTDKKEPEPSPQQERASTTPLLVPSWGPHLDLPDYDPEPAGGVRVGESPVPGLTLRHILRGHTSDIHHIAWSPDGRLLASPSSDQTIRIWDVTRGECVAVIEEHEHEVNSVAWSPDGHRLASSSYDDTIRIWDTEDWETLAVLEQHKGAVYSVAWSPDGRRLASGSDDENIRIWDTEAWETLAVLKQHKGTVYSMAWSPDGCRLASGSFAIIDIWNSTTGTVECELKGHRGSVTSGSLGMSIAIYRPWCTWVVGSDGEYKPPNRPVHDDAGGFGHGVPLAYLPTQRGWDCDSKLWRLVQTR